MKKTSYIILLLVCISGIHLFGQTRSKRDSLTVNHQLKEVKVTTQRAKKLKRDTLSQSLKLQQPIIQIPQNIISVSSELLQQQGALQLKDVAKDASGVYFGYNSTPFDNSAAIYIRGFQGYSTINGMSRRLNYGASIDDQALFESVEIIKGPAGFLNSFGQPSGTLNIVTKTPTTRLLNVEANAGNFNLWRFTADAGSQVKDKGFSYRFNAAYQYQGSYLDLLNTKKYIVAPVLQYNFSPKTYILAEYDYVRGEANNGISITKVSSEAEVLKNPIHFHYNAATGLLVSIMENKTARLLGVHKFNDHWQITSQSSYHSAPYDTWYMTSSGSEVNFNDQGNTKRQSLNSQGIGRTFTTQLFLNGRFKTGQFLHQIVAGGDYIRSRDSISSKRGKNQFLLNKSNPDYAVDPNLVIQTNLSFILQNNTSFSSTYFYDNVQLQKKWFLSFGARYTWYTNERVTTTSRGAGIPAKYNQKALSPRAALTFMPDSTTSIFFLYDQSFIPQSGQRALVDANNQVIGSAAVDPQRGNDLEVGIKKNWFNSLLLTSVDGFHTIKKNILVTDLEHQGFVKQIGEVTSNGIEADIIGNITRQLSLVANYTYVNAKITKDANTSIIGNRLSQTPQQIFNTWVQYNFPLHTMGKLAVSLGQTTIIKRATSEPASTIPNYTKFDASLSYTYNKYYVRLLADNLTNKRYMASGDILNDYPYSGHNYYYVEGDPFNIRVTLGIKF